MAEPQPEEIRRLVADMDALIAKMASGGAVAGPPEWTPDKRQMRQVSSMPDGSVWLTVVTRLKGCGRRGCPLCGD